MSLIVIIDDDFDDLVLMKQCVLDVNASFDCMTFHDPAEAVETLTNARANPPDFIFIDMNMPKLMGDACLKILREAVHLEKVVIAMISTSMSTCDSQALREAGANFTFSKPNLLDGYYSMLHKIFSPPS